MHILGTDIDVLVSLHVFETASDGRILTDNWRLLREKRSMAETESLEAGFGFNECCEARRARLLSEGRRSRLLSEAVVEAEYGFNECCAARRARRLKTTEPVEEIALDVEARLLEEFNLNTEGEPQEEEVFLDCCEEDEYRRNLFIDEEIEELDEEIILAVE